MFKLILSLLVITTLSACAFPKVIAQASEPDGKMYYQLYDNGSLKVTKVSKKKRISTLYPLPSKKSEKHKVRLFQLLEAYEQQQAQNEQKNIQLQEQAEQANAQRREQQQKDKKVLDEYEQYLEDEAQNPT